MVKKDQDGARACSCFVARRTFSVWALVVETGPGADPNGTDRASPSRERWVPPFPTTVFVGEGFLL